MVKHIVILGAGISGLATAWFLKKLLGSSVQLTLLEANSRAGGWIQTIHSQDFLFETGPRSCRSKGSGREMLQLIEELGLCDEVIGAHSSANLRFLYFQKKLQPLPSSFFHILFNPLVKGWLKAVYRDLNSPRSLKEDESIEEFFSRRIGKEWTSRLIDPFVSGIYAGDCKKLSMKSCFPLFWKWEQENGSLIKGIWNQKKEKKSSSAFVSYWMKQPLFSFKQGMGYLIQSFVHQLDANIHFSSTVKAIEMEKEGATVVLDNEKVFKADHLISTLPASKLAPLLGSEFSETASLLQSMESTSVMVVNCGYRRPVLKKSGFGYLIPFQEKESILGCVWDSAVFPKQNFSPEHTRLTVMMGGTQHPQIDDRQKGLALALSSIERHLAIDSVPDEVYVSLAKQAIPQYQIGHYLTLINLSQSLSLYPQFTFTGHSFDGVSVNDRVLQARLLAVKIAKGFNI
ncbi:protoporphyrinogen oxidase [Candidatus Protochlamydia sp. R18]|uniref:protoporphyrinogen oxidase n=1 Tax=Candidatus Protochlamydia sp. R18 TaxID=1353977 RepID=UPI0005A8D49D|nr:protoporphyrinogen oxidase [Candidatus Protochlamydia sp. R18]